MYKFNSKSKEYKKPFGAMASGEVLKLKLTTKDGIYIHRLWLEIMKDGESPLLYPMKFHSKIDDIAEFRCEVTLSSVGIYWYRFLADTEKGLKFLGKGIDSNVSSESEQWYQQTVYDKHYTTPEFIKGGVIYHIFVDRFNRGKDDAVIFNKKGVLKQWNEDVTIVDADGVFRANDFYGGNLQGIIDRLDYLAGLGVTLIYLSPIFESASNHRYDTADYMKIDPLLGDEDSFIRLIKAAKARGMGIMLDGVFNHTGSDSRYFNKYNSYDTIGAYQGKESPYYDWYHFINFPNEYGCWWGITVTPTVNKRVESYRRFIFGKNGVVDKWSKLGVAGWRLDVVDELDEDFVDELRNAVKSVSTDNLLIGEVWEDASIKTAYGTLRPYLLGNQLDGVMNYPFKEAIVDYILHKDVRAFSSKVMSICENYPPQALNCCMTLIGTHDTSRAINRLSGINVDNTSKQYRLHCKLNNAERERGIRLMKIASVMQYTLPGVPSVYYGDEVGLEGFEDPINRRTFPWDNINHELLEHYKKLGAMRSKYRDLMVGDMTVLQHEALLIYQRSNGDRVMRVVINMSDSPQMVSVTHAINAISGEQCEDIMSIAPQGYLIIITNA